MPNPQLTDKALKEIQEKMNLDREAWLLLDLIVAEWESDPMSVQCFDLRIIERGKIAIKRKREIDIFFP